jgi:hypothetical protein
MFEYYQNILMRQAFRSKTAITRRDTGAPAGNTGQIGSYDTR